MNQDRQAFTEDVLSLTHGAMVLQLPTVISQEDCEDIGDFLVLVLERIKRQAARKPAEGKR